MNGCAENNYLPIHALVSNVKRLSNFKSEQASNFLSVSKAARRRVLRTSKSSVCGATYLECHCVLCLWVQLVNWYQVGPTIGLLYETPWSLHPQWKGEKETRLSPACGPQRAHTPFFHHFYYCTVSQTAAAHNNYRACSNMRKSRFIYFLDFIGSHYSCVQIALDTITTNTRHFNYFWAEAKPGWGKRSDSPCHVLFVSPRVRTNSLFFSMRTSGF